MTKEVLGILSLDLLLSVFKQLRIRKAVLTPSDNPELNQLMEASTGPGGLEAFGKVLDEKIKNTPPVDIIEQDE